MSQNISTPTRRSNVTAALFTSATDEWGTPQEFFDVLDAEFHFTLDPCATPSSAKCDRYFTKKVDGLAQPWSGRVFMNPPYGRVIGAWLRKAWQESQQGATIVCLIPARTDPVYWHDYVMRAAEVRFVRGRLRFDDQDGGRRNSAPFPSVVVVFRPDSQGPPVVSAMARVTGEAEVA